MRLFHFCCVHSAERIDRDGLLRPSPVPWREVERMLASTGWHISTGLSGAPTVLWLTDLATPDRDGLGLTSSTISCDRTAIRYAVETADAWSWDAWATIHGATREWRSSLEALGKPKHWFVSTQALLPVAKSAVSEREGVT